jgi:hypothetical protein
MGIWIWGYAAGIFCAVAGAEKMNTAAVVEGAYRRLPPFPVIEKGAKPARSDSGIGG